MDKGIEKDMLGEKQIAQDALWGIHTQRALENFGAKGRYSPVLIYALTLVKKAAANANADIGALDQQQVEAISYACDQILTGEYDTQFPLEPLQGGAGTSTNMNVNEVIANIANEKCGASRGSYQPVHPLDHVNLNQSTNDVYPTAVKIAAVYLLRDLSKAAENLQGVFQQKENQFAQILKIAKTELQDAVPITLGAEFSSFAEAISRDRWRTFKCEERLRTVNIGGTAVGTGLGAPRAYIFLVIEKLRELTGIGLARGENLMGETANIDSFVEVSGIIKAHATNLMKIANDLRLLSVFNEINLPKMQAGSSIMPGKVNPVICESVIQHGIKVIANDLIVAETASRSSLQINEFMPLLSQALIESLQLLIHANNMLAKMVKDITANEEVCLANFERAQSLITAFVPKLGYKKCEELLSDFQQSGQENLRMYLESSLGKDLVSKTLTVEKLLSLGYREEKDG